MMQATKEFHWKNPNGNQIYAVEWPVENARAVIGLIHGMGEHIRRYDGMVDWYRQHEIACVGYDRQGFGRSEGKRAYANSYKVFVDEVARLVVECERRYPDLPVFLYGHSFGGQTLLRYLIKRKPHISGAIATGPHLQLSFQPNPLIVALGKITRKLIPTFTQENQLDTSKLSRRAEVVKAYTEDPYVTSKLTSQTGIDVLEIA
ncbi:MAG: alpha/beta fold hydrolase, partial [Bacteroidota bacterium]